MIRRGHGIQRADLAQFNQESVWKWDNLYGVFDHLRGKNSVEVGKSGRGQGYWQLILLTHPFQVEHSHT